VWRVTDRMFAAATPLDEAANRLDRVRQHLLN
jgi:hypothetical protein